MIIEKLVVSDVRNIDKIQLIAHPRCNIIVGNNGSGKTSILESIHLLGFGRSFRTHKNQDLVQKQKESLMVLAVGATSNDIQKKFGIRKTLAGISDIRIDGKTIRRQSELSSFFPIVNCSPLSNVLLEDGPAVRRRFVDWLVFHVEHETIAQTYKEYERAIDQRNRSLKLGNKQLANSWTPQLVSLNKTISAKREHVINELNERCKAAFKILGQEQLLELAELEIKYKRGWRLDGEIEELLTSSLDLDLKRGTTHYGIHRDDMIVSYGESIAKTVLSRGELKILLMCLLIAASQYIEAHSDKQCIWLIDDIVAELDKPTLDKLLSYLLAMQRQLFVTCIEKDLPVLKEKIKHESVMFHVEHGTTVNE
ncbi:DNA replication/repair protein RecF [Algibacillus agarilyticus]|uniref:DNA replication/repair protein RecF n=1 Tax=Algibacillus agarilyticus TaxID=2234133 RepID=UPI000DCF9AF5|nr:DNA replication and repair protein RecF [Algibacillus agarilyticus]